MQQLKATNKHERKSSSEDGIHYVDDDDGVEFALDARHLNRVHEELEKLNIATDVINKLELQLGSFAPIFDCVYVCISRYGHL